jgi:hypothetical protein
VYINLGADDHLMLGEKLEVLRPDRPVLGESGDTLGWAEVRAAVVTVRSIKAGHFSQAMLSGKTDSVQVGWTVRAIVEEKKGRAQ